MQITLLAFAQARDRLGFAEQRIEGHAGETPRQILRRLGVTEELAAWRIAADGEYVDWDEPLTMACELAIIPPVSGG